MEQKASSYKWLVTEELLQKVVEVIRREVDPEKIIMFGSRARGENRDDSDLDLIVIEQEPFKDELQRFREIGKLYRILEPFEVPKDILVYGRDEPQKYRHWLNHVLTEALQEGEILYEKS